MESTCQYCNRPLAYEPIPDYPNLKPNVCPDCGLKLKVREAAQKKAHRLEEWRRLCPPLFQDTDRSHPGMPPTAILDRILGWPFGPKGLVIYGPTRTGKTRSTWLLIKRLMVEDAKRVRVLTSGELARQCALAYGTGAEEASAWFNDLARADVLFIDDFGKMKMTERVEAELFELLDYRTSHRKPVILTTNYVGTDLLNMMSADRAEPTLARIREFCTPVALVERSHTP